MSSIVIVGAGLVGPVIACYLAQRGHDVRIFERRPDPRSTPPPPGKSVHLVVSERGWRALRDVGADGAVRRISLPLRGRTIHAADGRLTFQPYGGPDQCIYAVSRTALNEAILTAAEGREGVRFHFDARCVGVDFARGAVSFEEAEGGRVRTVEGAVVLGADGAFSAVRTQMLKRERFNFTQTYLEWGYRELRVPVAPDARAPLDPTTMHVWPRGAFMLSAFPNLDGSFTASLFLPFEGRPSFASLQTEGELFGLFEAAFPDAVPLMPELGREFFTHPTSTLITLQCWPWTAAGKVALIGDAAHSVVPFYGQGMNAGFEDCTTFDQCVARHGDDWPAVLAAYERARKPNTDALAELSLKNFVELRDRVGDPEFLRRKRIERRLGEQFPGKFFPMYSMIAFSDVPYAEAKRIGEEQDALVDRLAAIEDVEENWDGEAVRRQLAGFMP
ncbi:MAG TPA: NAD(P)/FAD-dependent oxidoreductase [Polyangiaceae bacterium]|nr:NAD(P)/FAD-dependent oxidoreductase [Polyangiaceae bacterium]